MRIPACAGLIVAAALAGCGSTSSSTSMASQNLFDDSITQQQYAGLRVGEDQQTIIDRVQHLGKPETTVADRFVALFPRHDPKRVLCDYWQVTGDSALLVQLCFSSRTEKLVRKLEQRA